MLMLMLMLMLLLMLILGGMIRARGNKEDPCDRVTVGHAPRVLSKG